MKINADLTQRNPRLDKNHLFYVKLPAMDKSKSSLEEREHHLETQINSTIFATQCSSLN